MDMLDRQREWLTRMEEDDRRRHERWEKDLRDAQWKGFACAMGGFLTGIVGALALLTAIKLLGI